MLIYYLFHLLQIYYKYSNINRLNQNNQRIIDSLPGQLKKYAICFSQQKFIVNTNLFKLDINIASTLLPFMTIFFYQQYETIYYLGSISQDIYILTTGEMRLCDEQGRSLLNIIDGIIFGEIEILDQVNRKKREKLQSKKAISEQDIINLHYFQKIKKSEEFCRIKRKIFNNLIMKIQYKFNKMHNDFIKSTQNQYFFARAVSCINQNEQRKPTDISKYIMEKEFKQRIKKQSFQFLQIRLLKIKMEIISKAQKCCLESDEIQQKKKAINKRRRGSYLGYQRINNFKGTTENEKRLKNKYLNCISKIKRTIYQNSKVNNQSCKIRIISANAYYSFTLFLSYIKRVKIIILEKKEKRLNQSSENNKRKVKSIHFTKQGNLMIYGVNFKMNQFHRRMQEQMEFILKSKV
ncbi:unnamed protein product [Paramecium pentaurelia]|uniref:Cyclic nucleotide-binding domain-containing protein n=1 Tax=Paramecium pentaurelia TaxID=43138 RepID=A0A8S1UGI0_9CILI|nr:unnamed protein product [Paramecium pentaurelia]